METESSKPAPVRVAVIGLGFIGANNFCRLVNISGEGGANPLCKVVAVSDPRPEREKGDLRVKGNLPMVWPEEKLRNVEWGKMGIAFFPNCKGLLEAVVAQKLRLDAAYIAIPTLQHAVVTMQFLVAGLHVLCEKPLVRNVKEALQLTFLPNEKKRILSCGHCMEFWEPYAWLLSNKERLNALLRGVRAAAFFRGSAMPGWSTNNHLINQEASGGCVYDMSIHDMAIACRLWGLPDTIRASGSIRDGLIVSSDVCLGYNGFNVAISCSWQAREFNQWFNIRGFDGDIRHNNNLERSFVVLSRGRDITPGNLSAEDGYYGMLRNFLCSVQDNCQPLVTPELAVNACMIAGTAERLILARDTQVHEFRKPEVP